MKFVSPPKLTDSFSVAADWLELLCLLRPTGEASDNDLTAPGGFLEDRAAIVEIDATSEEYDQDIIDPAQENGLNALFEEVGRRKQELGQAYPFDTAFLRHHLRLKRAEELQDESVSSGRDVYRACLLMSALRSGIIDARAADIQVDPTIGNLFQVCATLAAAGYIKGDAYWFGAPRPDNTPLIDAVKKLAGLLKTGQARGDRPPGETMHAKDAGVDVVAWRHHADERPAKIIIYGQCASGMNWEGKPVAAKVDRLNGYYFEPPSKHWLPALLLPFPLYMGKENTHGLRTEENMKGFYSQIEKEMGLILDRSRVVLYAIEALRQTEPSAKVAADKLHTVVDWCAQTTQSVRGEV